MNVILSLSLSLPCFVLPLPFLRRRHLHHGKPILFFSNCTFMPYATRMTLVCTLLENPARRDHKRVLDLPDNIMELNKKSRCKWVKNQHKALAKKWHPDKAKGELATSSYLCCVNDEDVDDAQAAESEPSLCAGLFLPPANNQAFF